MSAKSFRFVDAQLRLRYPSSKAEISFNGHWRDTFTVRYTRFDASGVLTHKLQKDVPGHTVRSLIDMDIAVARQRAESNIGSFIPLSSRGKSCLQSM